MCCQRQPSAHLRKVCHDNCLANAQATLAAANVASVLQKYPVANKPDVLPWVDGEFDAIPKAAPSIVNAEDLSLEIQS